MKINKQVQMQIFKQIKDISIREGFKANSSSIYKVMGDNFVHVDYLIVESKKLVFRIYVKKYSYDKIFWTILKMDENLKKKDSLRATGAFRAPSILIKKGEYEYLEDVKELSESFVSEVITVINSFLVDLDINKYVITHEDLQDNMILKCLAYIDADKQSKAVLIAKKELENENKGRFENDGKGFFEWLLF
ncbi:hypothetical protein [Lachnotalea glycerini]|uniref:DUF4304 domain-containing protein n=1 Tax=Lachnotalea glycerini TaxID=1763509 RepID=A0A371JHL9_9FIRM|nr:hypothetical protein [Lachnotalea glycerini]RDY32223.1 hypothetical protein CG710_005960 [Lachnotalea glycerini]